MGHEEFEGCARRARGACAPARRRGICRGTSAPADGIPEDPATGSAHCMIAPFFSKRLGKPELKCFQAYPTRGADITTRMVGDRVKLVGRARTVIEGVFRA